MNSTASGRIGKLVYKPLPTGKRVKAWRNTFGISKKNWNFALAMVTERLRGFRPLEHSAMPTSRDDDPANGANGPFRAVELANARRDRVVALLSSAKVPYAIAGECATAAWVARADESGVRNTREIHVVLRRKDSPSVVEAMASVGFSCREVPGGMILQDPSTSKVSNAVHVYFALERYRPEHLALVPDVVEVDETGAFPTLSLEALVRLALTLHKLLDLVNLRDLIDVGLIDDTWPARFPPELAKRLKAILDDPNG